MYSNLNVKLLVSQSKAIKFNGKLLIFKIKRVYNRTDTYAKLII